jgi:cystathionine beta-lyase/cystathionine gamma-synthase
MSRQIETSFIHAGDQVDPRTKSVTPGIFLATTYQQHRVGVSEHEYSRGSNPTRNTLERAIAECEQAKYGVCFSSGLSAIQATLSLYYHLPEISILATDDLYGGTARLFGQRNLSGAAINLRQIDFCRDGQLTEALTTGQYQLVWIESPTNPLLKEVDLSVVCPEIRRLSPRSTVVVDNTFATPYLQRPITLGADVVVHSATKYLNGHSDVIAGMVVTSQDEIYERVKRFQCGIGAVLSPFDCYLTIRGLKTLHVRLDRQCENAEAIHHFLLSHQEKGRVKQVYYPEPKNMSKRGGMISFVLDRDDDFIRNEIPKLVKTITIAESLGAVETLLNVPYYMTHASLSVERRLELGITPQLIRLSVGIEHIRDLLSDLELLVN